MRHLRCAAIFVAVLLVSGCGRPSEPIAVVYGRITMENKPVNDCYVLFWPADNHNKPDQQPIIAHVDGDGFFALNCRAGKYHIAISPSLPEGVDDPGPLFRPSGASKQPSRVPPHYWDARTTPFIVELSEGKRELNLSIDAGRSPDGR
ncbi:MAG: hypothetical protein KatS3mg105_4600 [Gemmatales bacterium]|nr:MAG: hypothetical protein KatS3mg105_4600 [Gemmatales bacterium]